MSEYDVVATRWDHGWERPADGVDVTQCATLDHAERQARDVISTMLDRDAFDGPITITPTG